MARWARFALLSLVLATIVVMSPGSLDSQQQFEISGEVLDRGNKPIASVLVQLYRGSRLIGEDRADASGKYSIKFGQGPPIDTVRYEHSDWNPATVEDLSGGRNQRINKTMYARGSKLGLFEVQESLSALERIYYIEVANNTPLEKFQPAYAPVLKVLVVPKDLNERYIMVMKLYRLG